jgi:hypothetical protein
MRWAPLAAQNPQQLPAAQTPLQLQAGQSLLQPRLTAAQSLPLLAGQSLRLTAAQLQPALAQ